MNFKERVKELEDIIQDAYPNRPSLDEAEGQALNFCSGILQVSAQLSVADLEARMRKSGLKGIRAALYLDIVQNSEKKPTETAIDSMITVNELVAKEQQKLDEADVAKADLERLYETFNHVAVLFRQMSRGVQG